jgi:hypothetical protein
MADRLAALGWHPAPQSRQIHLLEADRLKGGGIRPGGRS